MKSSWAFKYLSSFLKMSCTDFMAFLGDRWRGLTILRHFLLVSHVCAYHSMWKSKNRVSWSPILPLRLTLPMALPEQIWPGVDAEFCRWLPWVWPYSPQTSSEQIRGLCILLFFSRNISSTSWWPHLLFPLASPKHSFFISIQGSLSPCLWIKFKVEL